MQSNLPDSIMQYVSYNEPLANRTTFKVGGTADIFIRPLCDVFPDIAGIVLRYAKESAVPLFILGGGANLVVSDKGIRGMVLDTGEWSGTAENMPLPAGLQDAVLTQEFLTLRGGTLSDTAADIAAERRLSGLEFLAGLPGTIGGAVWMNARCWDKSVASVLYSVEILDENGSREIVPFKAEDWDYKKSPFQKRKALIVSACFLLQKGSEKEIAKANSNYRNEREKKGHYRYPSAGSVFKNNHFFGKPTGKIVEELGLRGKAIGGAKIADWHGNFIVNTGGASASDIRALTEFVQHEAREKLNINLEHEIIFLGEW